jgi:hypothetical protein
VEDREVAPARRGFRKWPDVALRVVVDRERVDIGLVAQAAEQVAHPPREHPRVAFDFWEQVTEAEEMDEIRPFRPAAFQALPKATEAGTGAS